MISMKYFPLGLYQNLNSQVESYEENPNPESLWLPNCLFPSDQEVGLCHSNQTYRPSPPTPHPLTCTTRTPTRCALPNHLLSGFGGCPLPVSHSDLRTCHLSGVQSQSSYFFPNRSGSRKSSGKGGTVGSELPRGRPECAAEGRLSQHLRVGPAYSSEAPGILLLLRCSLPLLTHAHLSHNGL